MRDKQRLQQVVQKMKLLVILTLAGFYTCQAEALGQNNRITLHVSDAVLSEVLRQIEDLTGYMFVYKSGDIERAGRVTLKAENMEVSEILNKCFAGSGLSYVFENDVIIISKAAPQPEGRKITGKVTDENGEALPGVTVIIKGTSLGTSTDIDGNYVLTLPAGDHVLIFSMVGMNEKEVAVGKQSTLNVILSEGMTEMDEVVVQGIFQKKLSSYTGAAVTASAEEIKQVGSLNVIQALNAIDPSIRLESNLFDGSNPNVLPEITIRGENGLDLRQNSDENMENPNAPLYILDGMEVSARQIYDMDMNRIESVTILKDASATALYGSRGANGIILITTKAPLPGEIRTTFNANFNVSVPDLRDYNLMNAEEKLKFERLAGLWTGGTQEEQERLDQEYNERLKEVQRGVNTYWLSKPLRIGVNQRYALYFEGGSNQFRYGINLRYDNDQGVMKGSGRSRLGLEVNFRYNIGTKLYINNTATLEEVKEKNSPYGNFSTYAYLNPIDRPYDEEGNLIEEFWPNNESSRNPLVNASLPNFDKAHNIMLRDYFNVDWWVINGLRVRGSLAYTRETRKAEVYKSPGSTDFLYESDASQRGSYQIDNTASYSVDGNLNIMYSKTFNEKHLLSVGVGSDLQVSQSDMNGFIATGFVSDRFDYVGAATQFLENSTPRASYDMNKLIGFFANVNYGYDDRYFIDASYRTDGSSKFGKDSRFAPFWSVGLAWNLHNEKFWNENPAHTLKIRGSIGNTGTVNFSSSQALTTYYYDTSKEYNGIYGASLKGYGNPALKWQNTRSYDVGFDLTLFDNRFSAYVDFYIKDTDNLLLSMDVAPSVGFSSYTENIGESRNKGWEGRFRIMWVDNKERDINWSTTFAIFQNRNKIMKLSNTLEALNSEALSDDATSGRIVYRQFAEGRSQSALMVVQSAGIDPATGQEVYVKLDGTKTFTYDASDKIMVGDMNPKAEGTITSNFNWGGFNLYLLFKYQWGGKAYNGTLASKVEGCNPRFNADRRALEERWQKPGDDVYYTSIKNTSGPKQTTRFVFDDNLFSLQSVSASYDLPRRLAEKIGAERIKFNVSTTDVFRLSTIKQERGTSYPFAWTFTAGLNVTF